MPTKANFERKPDSVFISVNPPVGSQERVFGWSKANCLNETVGRITTTGVTCLLRWRAKPGNLVSIGGDR